MQDIYLDNAATTRPLDSIRGAAGRLPGRWVAQPFRAVCARRI